MSIKYVKGDAVEALKNGEVDFLVHCCNAQGVMGSGIAKQIKKEFPDAYNVYRQSYIRKQKLPLGSITYSDGVFNLVGQEYYGYDGKRYMNYGAIAKGFNHIKAILMAGGFEKGLLAIHDKANYTIAIPYKFACDRAGGDWDIVLELITVLLGPYDIKIYHLRDL